MGKMLNSKKSTKAGGSCPVHSNGERGKHWKLPYCLKTTIIGSSIYSTLIFKKLRWQFSERNENLFDKW